MRKWWETIGIGATMCYRIFGSRLVLLSSHFTHTSCQSWILPSGCTPLGLNFLKNFWLGTGDMGTHRLEYVLKHWARTFSQGNLQVGACTFKCFRSCPLPWTPEGLRIVHKQREGVATAARWPPDSRILDHAAPTTWLLLSALLPRWESECRAQGQWSQHFSHVTVGSPFLQCCSSRFWNEAGQSKKKSRKLCRNMVP